MTNNTIRIVDTTLREGIQSSGVKLNISSSVEIATCLVKLGVDMIECGHPGVSESEIKRVKAVVKASAGIPVLAHSRARRDDIECVLSSDADWIGIFAGINSISKSIRVRPEKPIMEVIKETISFARSNGLKVRFTVEDGSRTSSDTLIQAFKFAIDAGANRICIADTVGAMTTWDFESLVSQCLTELPGTDIEVHCHDDRGLAMANALVAARAGINWISSSVNGIGERCGITDTITLMSNLNSLGCRTSANGKLMQYTSQLVQSLTRTPMDRLRPATGENATSHVAKLHQRAVRANPMAYAWKDPSEIGRKNIIGSNSLPKSMNAYINTPSIIEAGELKHHRNGLGDRYLMLDDRVVSDARQYCIVRDIPKIDYTPPDHVDFHRHTCDSLFLFIGHERGLTGLQVEVFLESKSFKIDSPCSVLIPSGIRHRYRIINGSGIFVNHVLAGNYNKSILEPLENKNNSYQAIIETYIQDRCPSIEVKEDTELHEVLDSLLFLDLFVYLEEMLGDQVSLDEVAECHTFGDLYVLIEGAMEGQTQKL